MKAVGTLSCASVQRSRHVLKTPTCIVVRKTITETTLSVTLSGHSAQMARFVDYAMHNWVDGKGGWMDFNNTFESNCPLEEKQLIKKFYVLICLNTF